MRVAFYAPLKPPDHPTPSGDRRMARSLLLALEAGGHTPELASRLRSYDRAGDAERQQRLASLGDRLAERWLQRHRQRPPAAWLSYHVYHKSPDWLGPRISRALGLPYLIVEASFAPKQAAGPWAHGLDASAAAIRAADVVLALTALDIECLAPLVTPPAELWRLPPFLDPAPLAAAAALRADHRAALAGRLGLDPTQPWLLAVAMMRADVKRCSYMLLAQALARLRPRRFQLLVVGDGPARGEIRAALEAATGGRVAFAGALAEAELAAIYAAADLLVWPAVGEAYGLAMLEAQASGLAVVAGREGGVAEVVADGRTGLLTPPRDVAAFAAAVARLLDRPAERRRLATEAAAFVQAERSLAGAARRLDDALLAAVAIRAQRP